MTAPTHHRALTSLVPKPTKTTLPLTMLVKGSLKSWLTKQRKPTQAWVQSIGFRADPGEVCLIPSRDGSLERVVVGMPATSDAWSLSALPAKLPKGRYMLDGAPSVEEADKAAFGWALGTYRFDRYLSKSKRYAQLVWPEASQRDRVSALVAGITLGRDLISTPASDMGPEELAGAAQALAEEHAAKCTVIVGKKLLEKNYPTIHAVGRASTREPRLIDLTWGDSSHPKLTLVGKGVCFDSGGLDLKSAANMKLMKKDMGGAATILGLAHAIMAQKLSVRLRVLIPAVENSVSGNAFRPMDILTTRKGLRVEIGNTDAEGRLVLCDALTEADSESPDLIIDMATLTGAARVALGTELPALFCNDDEIAESTLASGLEVGDPMWRMPLHNPYRRLLDTSFADLNNISSGGYGGAITAALYLREFVSNQTPWIHVDTMAWNLDRKAGRPAGGETFGLRALFTMLERRYGSNTA